MPLSNLRLLVVEDHAFQCSMQCQLLRTLGAASVVGLESARDALRRLEDDGTAFDAVILDLMMDGMDGIEFMRHASKLAPGLPVVVSSACDAGLLAGVAQVAEAYGVPLAGMVQKPMTATKLLPVLAGLRSRPATDTAASRFSLREITDAWAREEFEPLFEPRVHLATGTVASVDLRPGWRHPSLGMLAASQFLPAIVARGVADEFALLMVGKALQRCRKWLHRGLALSMSAVLPVECLGHPRLAERIHGLAMKEEVDPGSLLLQVPCGGAAPDGLALENLARLRMRGFPLGAVLRDAGPGALDTLRCAPFSELRLQRGAYAAAARGSSVRHALAACIRDARARPVRVVGAGLASRDEWTLLLEAGCELAHGPFVSAPLEGGAVAAWVAERAGATIR